LTHIEGETFAARESAGRAGFPDGRARRQSETGRGHQDALGARVAARPDRGSAFPRSEAYVRVTLRDERREPLRAREDPRAREPENDARRLRTPVAAVHPRARAGDGRSGLCGEDLTKKPPSDNPVYQDLGTQELAFHKGLVRWGRWDNPLFMLGNSKARAFLTVTLRWAFVCGAVGSAPGLIAILLRADTGHIPPFMVLLMGGVLCGGGGLIGGAIFAMIRETLHSKQTEVFAGAAIGGAMAVCAGLLTSTSLVIFLR
jgi:hypothetical protein